jgi:hypothetical protein
VRWLLGMDVRLAAAIIAAFVSLLVALANNAIAFARMRSETTLTRRSERAIRKLMKTGKGPFIPFGIIRHHIGGYSDDDLRQLLVRCGALRFADPNMVELWALLSMVPRQQRTDLTNIEIPASASKPPSKLFPQPNRGVGNDQIRL